MQADKYGVRIAGLDEFTYRKYLWNHKPLTDFWRVGKGISQKLEKNGMLTMGDIAKQSVKEDDYKNNLTYEQKDMFIDYNKLAKQRQKESAEKSLQKAVLETARKVEEGIDIEGDILE